MAKKLNVGLIGYQFMGKAHSNAYRQVGRYFDLPIEPVMKTLCGRSEDAVKAAADKLGWQSYETDWRKVVEDQSIDIIDIATPGDSHCEIACAAAAAGKIVFCEKPLGNTLAEAKTMLDAVTAAKVPHAIYHNYRKAPAVAFIKKLLDEGRLGDIYHWRATYLQDWIADPTFPIVWRLQKERAGSGTHGDLAAHLIDMARYLMGDIDEVSGLLHTFVTKRPIAAEVAGLGAATASDQMGDVTVDDASLFLAKFKNGALGTFEASRFAMGHKNYNSFEINGSKGSVSFNLERMNEYRYYDDNDLDGTKGFRVVQATEGVHPYAGRYWPVAHIIGYEHTFVNLLADAFEALDKGTPISPNFIDGYENQKVLDAVERSNLSRAWVSV